jgi:signal transduction histidine kinase
MSALSELTESSARFFGITCTFECPEQVLVEDHAIGAHLFRIAQEALSNAIRHGEATGITISLTSTHHRLTLAIIDDGVGLSVTPEESTGMGLHIMNYRARMIGATLQAERHAARGTIVRCILPQRGKQLRELVGATGTEELSHAV